MIKIYFAGSIRGGRDDVSFYLKLIEHLKQYGKILTEHIGDKTLSVECRSNLADEYIYRRNLDWLFSSDVVVAEVSTASLGVGYEIGRVAGKNKKVLCLCRLQDRKKLSAMIRGCPNVVLKEYSTLKEAKKIIDDFFRLNLPLK